MEQKTKIQLESCMILKYKPRHGLHCLGKTTEEAALGQDWEMMSVSFFWQNACNYISEGFVTVYPKRNVVQAVPFTTTKVREKPGEPPTRLNMD